MANDCRHILLAFMKHRDDEDYERDHVFDVEHLGQVTAQDVVDYFNHKAHHNVNPTDDDRPVHARSSALLHWNDE